jgi:hypothetical protein
LQRIGDKDAAIGLLEIFKDCRHAAAHRQPGAVKRMHKLGAFFAFFLKADIGAPGLKIFKIAAG